MKGLLFIPLLGLLTGGSLNGAQAKRVTVVVLGSSTAAGKNLDQPMHGGSVGGLSFSWVNRFMAQLASQRPGTRVINLARSGSSSFEAVPTGTRNAAGRPAVDTKRNVTAAIALNADVLIVSFPSIPDGASVQEMLDNLLAIQRDATARGIPFWVSTPPSPLSSGDPAVTARLLQLRQGIIATFGTQALDFWNVLSLPNGTMDPRLLLGDGVHPNAEGHRLLFEVVSAAIIPATLAQR